MPTLNPLAGAFGRTSNTEDEDEYGLDIEALGGKKQAFSIFHDAPEDSPGRTIESSEYFSYSQFEGRTESPLEERRYVHLIPMLQSP